MIITIDGPAGAGKSSVAKLLAERLGFDYLDTGAMYRAVTLAGMRSGADLSSEGELKKLLADLQLEMLPGRVLVNGADVTEAIRSGDVSARSGPVSQSPLVRRRLVELQRQLAAGRDMVCEGRDQGTVVFPQAECKFYLVADPRERARRRHLEMQARGETTTFDAILAAQHERDERDAQRDLSPMKPAHDAVVLDSTHLTLAQVVDEMEKVVRSCPRP